MKALVVAFLSTIMLSSAASAAEIRVIGSPGFREAYTDLLPGFERSTGHHVTTIWGGVNEVAKRVAGGEVADIVILPAAQINDLIGQGKLAPETRVDVAKSGIGVAIRAGRAQDRCRLERWDQEGADRGEIDRLFERAERRAHGRCDSEVGP